MLPPIPSSPARRRSTRLEHSPQSRPLSIPPSVPEKKVPPQPGQTLALPCVPPADIVRRALRAPARQIADNAGEDGAYIVGKLLESDDYNQGFNAATGEYEDLVKSGVIDPAKVVRTALQDAASVASLLITTEALVAELPKEDTPAPMPAMDF